jgi:opacity protein-like surface antigen
MADRRLLGVIGIACSVTLAASSTVAGVGKGNWEVGFGLGTTEFDSGGSGDSGSHFDVRGGYFLTDVVQFEGQLSHSGTNVDNIDVSLRSALVNAVFNARPAKRAMLYGLVGTGYTTLEANGPPTVDDGAQSYQLAFGSRFFIGRTERVAVRVELSAISENTFDERSTHSSFTTGFTWRIGPDVATWRGYLRGR